MFETVDKEQCFTAQWFYRAEDTVSLTFSLTCLFNNFSLSFNCFMAYFALGF